MKIVVNRCYGGFELSEKAMDVLKEKGYEEEELFKFRFGDCLRNTNDLIKIVEELGNEANGWGSTLKVIEIPDNNTDWDIIEYDGSEYVIYVQNGQLKRQF